MTVVSTFYSPIDKPTKRYLLSNTSLIHYTLHRPYPTATCGMDALCHALEAFTSLRQNPYSDSIAIGVIAEVAEWLPKLLDNLSSISKNILYIT